MSIDLVGDGDIRHKKGDYYSVTCRLCKGSETRILSNGEPIWIKDINAQGNWTKQFLCYDCYYNGEKICYKCGIEQIVKSMHMMRHYNGYGLWTGKYICSNCHNRDKKNYRESNITLKISEGGGSVIDIVVSMTLGIQTCSIYAGEKKLPFCMIHEYYGIIGTKTSKLKNNKWYFNINDYVLADTYFCIGIDEKLKNIEAVYVISTDERVNNKKIATGRLSISKNSKKFKEFQIEYESYNHVFHNMNIEDTTLFS